MQASLQAVDITYQKTKSKPDKATKTIWPVTFALPLSEDDARYEAFTICRLVFLALTEQDAENLKASTVDFYNWTGFRGGPAAVFYFINVPPGQKAADVEGEISQIVFDSLSALTDKFSRERVLGHERDCSALLSTELKPKHAQALARGCARYYAGSGREVRRSERHVNSTEGGARVGYGHPAGDG